MHGRVQNYGESCRSLRRISTQHMRSVLPLATTTKKTVAVAGDRHCSLPSPVSTTSVTDSSFVKDGRQIKIGDCALFKPPQDCPPFIGLIRSLRLSKENNLQLEVNWLYRLSELKLGKGTLVDSAPNEIFYSFHKDETPAASLLHPCKVAFLPRGVELPAGTSSFVCRRVYDIANKCLWWLTDQNFINERQEEVDQLLHKTRTEMHATLQPDGRSPKQANGPNSTSQLKPASDSGQNSGSLPSQVKVKKRERVDHGSDPVKRGRSSRTDGDFLHQKSESNLKLEIARITERGGLVNLEGVDKLIELMKLDKTERKLELVSRSMLTGVMAATEKADCLSRFVQLRGLIRLDEWLQDAHKGKLGDGNSSKDGDKFVEEFLLVLLRALDKLPVNLHALQTCNIGRSVNHLRSHKNLEIQRKARTLVDLWKKRVEAEMISNDAKSNSTHTAAWPSKSRQPEASHGGSRTPSGSDVGIKSSITQNSASKTTSARSSHGENNVKSGTSSPGPGKPASLAGPKESQPRISIGDAPLIREDRSSSSNQSHNYSQTSSGKEDTKTSTPGSGAVSKISNSSARNRRSSGFPSSVTGSQKEASSIRSSSAQRTATPEKLTQPAFNSSDRVVEGPINEGTGHKLIVKIPNRVHSPAQGVGGGSPDDPAFMSSRVSSPILIEKHEQSEHSPQPKSDKNRSVASDTNVGPRQNNVKNDPTGSAEGVGLSAASDEEHRMTVEDPRRSMDAPPSNQWNPGKIRASSFSPMNALVESCAKYSEANSSMSLEDEVGMNLLASVAAGEISRGNLVSPSDSTERSIPAVDGVCNGDEAKSKSSPEDSMVRVRSDFSNDAECDKNKHASVDGRSQLENGFSLSEIAPNGNSGDKICYAHNTSGDVQGGESCKQFISSKTHAGSGTDVVMEADRSNEKSSCLSLPTSGEKVRDVKPNEEIHKNSRLSTVSGDGISNCKGDGYYVTKCEEKINNDMFGDKDKQTGETESSNHAASVPQSQLNGELNMGTSSMTKCNSAVVKDECVELSGNEKLQPAGSGQVESGCMDKIGESNEDIKGCIDMSGEEKIDSDLNKSVAGDNHGIADFCSTSDDAKNQSKDDYKEDKAIPNDISDPRRTSPGFIYHEAEKKVDLKECGSTCNQLDETVECAADASSSAAEVSDLDSKVIFDLNEGFNVDDGKYGDSVNIISSVAGNVPLLNASFPVTSTQSSHLASITVAAPAKGPFVPPEDLLRSKGELGWKGSAATSAFRPAEPRKVSEVPIVPATSPEASTSKHDRVLLDIDLNVPDERVLEEMASREFALAVDSTNDSVTNCAMPFNEPSISAPNRSSTRLDFDLNTVDEANDIGYCSTSNNHKGEGSVAPAKMSSALHSVDVRRDFDLNNGPGVEDNITDQFHINQQMKEGVPPQLSSAGLRVNSQGLGNISSWFLPGSTFSTVAVPSMLPDRGEQRFSIFPSGGPQRPFGPSGVNPFTPDVYRGSVMSSSPAMPLQPSPFQFPMFPFGASYPLSSAAFPGGATSYSDSVSGQRLFAPQMNPQFQVPIASMPSQFQRPFKVNLPDNRSNDGSDNRRWGRQGLDLNSGPGIMEGDVREDMLPPASGQHSIVSSQAIAEEHARMYSVSGGTLKRKEPEGSWENEFRYKQSSWQ